MSGYRDALTGRWREIDFDDPYRGPRTEPSIPVAPRIEVEPEPPADAIAAPTIAAAAPILDFSREVLGFHPWPRQAEILATIYREGIRTAVLRLGRRSGKGRIAAVIATYVATVEATSHLAVVPAGERVAIAVIARSQKQARIVHGYIRNHFERGVLPGGLPLRSLVVRDTDDEIELSNGVVVMTLPCHAASVRGLAVAVAILDEVAWWTGVDGSPLDAKEIWDAVVPATAQFPAGRVIVLSTPRWHTGFFPEVCARAASGQFVDMKQWHYSTAEMNPAIPASFLEQEFAADPASFRREYLAEFESGIGAMFEAETVRRAVQLGIREVPPLPSFSGYVMAADPAFTGDTFTLVIGHREVSSIWLDLVRGWRGTRGEPVNVDDTLDEIAALSRGYGRAPVLIDQYAAEPIRQGLHRRGVPVLARPWTNDSKLDAATATRRALQAGELHLLDHDGVVSELLALEQHPLPSGRPRIAAPGRSHDDFAIAVLALVAELATRQRRTSSFGAAA